MCVERNAAWISGLNIIIVLNLRARKVYFLAGSISRSGFAPATFYGTFYAGDETMLSASSPELSTILLRWDLHANEVRLLNWWKEELELTRQWLLTVIKLPSLFTEHSNPQKTRRKQHGTIFRLPTARHINLILLEAVIALLWYGLINVSPYVTRRKSDREIAFGRKRACKHNSVS